MIPDKVEVKKAQETAMELFRLNKRFKEQKDSYEAEKERLQTKIKNFMYSNGCDKFDFKFRYKGQEDLFSMKVNNVKQKRVIFDVQKLKEKLDKSVLKIIINKQYQINDFMGLVEYLKSCGVNPVKFKKFIDVIESPNCEEIERLGDIGELTMDDLKGCYEVRESEGYIKITESKDKEQSE